MMIAPSRPRWVLATLVLVALENDASSFQVIRQLPLVSDIRVRSTGQEQYSLQHRIMDRATARIPLHTRILASTEDGGDDDKKPKMSNEEIYEGLYEFLTRRTGEQAGESERRRKRDRIREWMGSSSSGSGGGSNLVQPLMEDGSVMEQGPPRTKAKFDRLFSGRPTLNEIISRDGYATETTASTAPTSNSKVEADSERCDKDDLWFEEEKRQIEARYEQMIDDAKTKIRQQRQEDPESMPENAEGVAESIVRQELDRMLKSVKLARAKERLEDYEIMKKSQLESREPSDETDRVVEQVLKEAAEEWKRKEALQKQMEDFLDYESEALGAVSGGNVPLPESDLDSWTLGRLQEMLRTTQQKASENSVAVTDILEQQIDDLKNRIEKESKKGSIKPQTMKEWQMYRAIATRLGREQGFDPKLDAALNFAEMDEDQVAQRLESWREYVGKEEEFRRKAGLAAENTPPFGWQQSGSKAGEENANAGGSAETTVSRREMRRQLNMQSIQAFEALIEKSDPARAVNLKKQLEQLKATLEPLDFVDVEDDAGEEQARGPIDLSDVFGKRPFLEDEPTLPSNLYEEQRKSIDEVLSSDAESIYAKDTGKAYKEPPPNSPFLNDSYDDEDEFEKPEAPRTPFFDNARSDEIDVANSKLGTADDQKLINMFRRAGARTKEEQDAIRQQWEAFQAFEKSKRDASGLSDYDENSSLENVDLKYDMSEVMTGDGDFDASKILSSIGPRPTRKKRNAPGSPKPTFDATGEEDEQLKSDLDPRQVADSLFRSVSAVGGGRVKDDPDSREKQKLDFDAYLQREEESRRKLDSLDDEAKKLTYDPDVPIDDERYAQDVLSSIGPRPVLKKKKQAMDERKLSDMGGVSNNYDDDIDPESDDDEDDEDDEPVDFVPEWLKKERVSMRNSEDYKSATGMSGRNIDEVFDDDKYDHNMRQLHEYEQRRKGKQALGIDISDVLGSRARSSDDYADYSFDTEYFRGRQSDWGEASFKARKANLLDYAELSTAELNNLMDHRESVYSTGVSQYLPRINKPFKEFGAVFRLEGILVDISGMQRDVWTKVAAKYNFKAPPMEEIRRAAVVRPDIAIREIFYWTNDVFAVREIVASFQHVMKDTFDEWASSNGLSARLSTNAAPSMALGADAVSETEEAAPSVSVPRFESEQSWLKRLQETWTSAARELELPMPSNEQIVQSTFLAPDISVRDVFRWTSDRRDIDLVVSVFEAILRGEEPTKIPGLDKEARATTKGPDRPSLLESQYEAWRQVAGSRSFTPPTPEEVLAAAVLNDPEVVVVRGFGWTDDRTAARDIADAYRRILAELLGNGSTTSSTPPSPNFMDEQDNNEARRGPSDEEILSAQVEAWNVAATKHAFLPPRPDQIQLTMNMSASDAVRRLLGWTHNFNEDQIHSITQTYSEALKEASQKFIDKYGLRTEEVPSSTLSNTPKEQGKEISADDIYKAAHDAWTNVAWQNGYTMPDQEQIQFALTVGPEEAIVVGFQWTSSYKKATEIAEQYKAQIKLKRAKWIEQGYNLSSSTANEQVEVSVPPVSVIPGVYDWIKSLLDVEMACGVTSHLDDDQVDILLQFAGLSDLFSKEQRVTASSGYDRDSQQMLGAALRIERRPDHCVAFESSPGANGAAHEVDMRSVAMVGAYPRYELLSADTSVASFEELTAMNIRRLFGERIYDQPMLDRVQAAPDIVRRTKTAFWDDD